MSGNRTIHAIHEKIRELDAMDAAIDAIRLDLEGDRYPNWVMPILQKIRRRIQSNPPQLGDGGLK